MTLPREELFFFPSGRHTLAGIVTIPANPIGRTAVIPWGAGAFPSSARNQLRTRLAREIAELGYHAFRFDYPGVGEADGQYQTPSLAKPFSEEIVAACQWLATQGLVRPVIIANCLGAWSTLKVLDRLPALEGFAAFNCPVRRDHEEVRVQQAGWRWWLSRLRRLRWRNLLSPTHRARYTRMVRTKAGISNAAGADGGFFSRQIETLVRSSVPIMLVYGDDGFRDDFDEALARGLGPVFDSAGPGSRPLLLSQRVEGFPTVSVQDQLVEATVSWLRESLAADDSENVAESANQS